MIFDVYDDDRYDDSMLHKFRTFTDNLFIFQAVTRQSYQKRSNALSFVPERGRMPFENL